MRFFYLKIVFIFHCNCFSFPTDGPGGQVVFGFSPRHLYCVPCSSGEMVRQARVLAQATSDLVNAMRSDAEAEVDVDNSKKLLAAAKLLADATARMVEAAKVKGDAKRLRALPRN